MCFHARVAGGNLCVEPCLYYFTSSAALSPSQHHYSSRRDEKNDKEPEEDEEEGATVVAVGFFPNVERESGETSGDGVYSQDGNNGSNAEEDEDEEEDDYAAVVDWEDLYTRGILASHSCRIRNNEQNVTFLQSPDFILAGVQKAGTTALFALLSCK
jgi:hypothetical protein